MDDNDLTRRLSLLADDISDGSYIPPAGAVRARGDRRRTMTTSALAGVATVAVATTTAMLPALGGAAGPELDVGTPSTPITKYVRTVSPSDLPSGVPASPGGPSPGGPSPGGSSPVSPPPGSGRTTFPPNLVMLHQGESGWQRSDDKDIAGTVNPCGTADATRAGRTAARTLTGPGLPREESHSPTLVTHQVFLYANATAADVVFTKLMKSGAECGWSNANMSGPNVLRLDKNDGYQPDVYWLYHGVVVRYGNALLLVGTETKGAGFSSAGADQDLNDIVAPLCAAGLVCR